MIDKRGITGKRKTGDVAFEAACASGRRTTTETETETEAPNLYPGKKYIS